jgi:ribosomal protein S19E (S16A)
MLNAFDETPPPAPALEPRKVPTGAARQIIRDELRKIRDAGGVERNGTRFFRYSVPGISHQVAQRLEAMGLIEWTQPSGDMRLGLLTGAGRKVAA